MKTKLEIIDETVAYYSEDPKGRRGIRLDDKQQQVGCEYITIDSKMCAVGRCGIDPHRMVIESGGGGVESFANEKFLDSLLKEEYRGHSIEFWSALQNLHDMANYWDTTFGNTISELGKQYAEALREKWKNN